MALKFFLPCVSSADSVAGVKTLMESPPEDFVGVGLSELTRKGAGWEAARH